MFGESIARQLIQIPFANIKNPFVDEADDNFGLSSVEKDNLIIL